MLSIIVILIYNPSSSYITYPFFVTVTLWIYCVSYLSVNKAPLRKKINLNIPSNPNTLFNKTDEHIKSRKVYLDKELNLKKVAELFDISSGYLSQLVNKNFNNYINQLRIEEAKIKLTNISYNNYTIALECNYKSNLYYIKKTLLKLLINSKKSI